MQKTSTEYVESMKKPLRNRAYLKASIGIVNSEAQNAVDFEDPSNSFAYFSNSQGVKDGLTVRNLYATSEENFTTVDNTMYFLPEEEEKKDLFHNGIVTEDILGMIKIIFSGLENITIKGVSIDFGLCYPTKFQILTDKDTKYYENSNSLFITDDFFNDINYMIIKPIEMIGGNDRLRINSFLCGVTKIFTNDNTFNATITDYTSPIADSVPSMDMSLTIDNQDQTYCPDDEENIYAALEQGQVIKMQFGYDVDGNNNIEWLQPYKCYLNQWSATDKDATFNGVDAFEYKLKDMYIYGNIYENGISLYELAKDIFIKAGLNKGEYKIDTYLKKIIVHNPIPVVTQAEALQIIANAGRCVLRIDRDGVIVLESSFIPELTISTNNKTEYSSLDNLLKNTSKNFYAESSQDYPSVNNTMILFPDDNDYIDNTGYVSESVYLEENGIYSWDKGKPKLTITFSSAWDFYGLAINFVSVVPREFTITTFLDGYIVQSKSYTNAALNFFDDRYYNECDKIEIDFVKGSPNSRVFVSSVFVSSATDYRLSRDFEMIGSPSIEKNDKVQSLSVITHDYLKSNDVQSAEMTLYLESGISEHIVVFDKPGYDFAVSLTEGSAEISIIESGVYFIKFSTTTTLNRLIKVQIQSKCYDIAEKPFTKTFNDSGKIIEWNNPLISDLEYAEKLEMWLESYYLSNLDYSISWRGDPRVDSNDLFYMELKNIQSKTREDILIRAYQSKLSFNGGWSGELKARKVK